MRLLVRNGKIDILSALFLVAALSSSVSARTNHSLFIDEYRGPAQCMGCHQNAMGNTDAVAYDDIFHSVHYRFESRLPEGYQRDVAGAVVDYTTSGKLWKLCGFPTTIPQINWLGNLRDLPETPHIDNPGGCARCHIGLGFKPFNVRELEGPTEEDQKNIDCLICHALDYNRKYYTSVIDVGSVTETVITSLPLAADGTPDYSLLTEAARTVGSTSFTTCLRCHAAAGGGKFQADHHNYTSFKRGSVYGIGKDVHANIGMSCSSCHYAGDHRFKRPLNNDLSAHDVVVDHEMCIDCHTVAPHAIAMYNDHTEYLSCTSCHATSDGGATYKDFSVTIPPDPEDPLDLYSVLVTFLTPDFGFDFQWFNGTVGHELHPFGSRGDGKIYPYKPTAFNQPVDANNIAIPIKWGPFFKSGNMTAALTMGRDEYGAFWTEEIGQKYGLPPTPGEFDHFHNGGCGGFSISHGITKDHALKCASCHNPTSVLDFEKLGYSEEQANAYENLLGLPKVGDFNDDDKVDGIDLLMFQEFWHGDKDAMLRKLQSN